MRYAGLVLSLLLALLILPALAAQDEKKDEDKKSPARTEKPPAEERLVYGSKFSGRLTKVDGPDFTVEVPVPDPKKIYDLKMWQAQQMQSIARQTNPFQRNQQMAQYKIQLAQKDTTKLQPVDIRAAENMKVRSNYPPVQFDDQGNLKRYTQKEIAALRGKSRWPGTFPADVDALKVGQVVEVYLAKPPPAPKGAKKKADLDVDLVAEKPEAVLVVVLQEVPLK